MNSALLFLIAAVSIIPVLCHTGFLPFMNDISFSLALLISVAGCTLLGPFIVSKWYKGLVAGLLAGLGVFFATYYYLDFRTSGYEVVTIYKFELAIGFIIGVIPSIILLVLWKDKIENQQEISETQSQETL